MSLEELEKRIQILEDVEEIGKLMANYCYFVDSFEWDNVVSLFVDDAKADYDILGKYDEKEGIEGLFKNVIPMSGSWFAHQILNPVIEVDGLTAKGKWYLLCLATTSTPEGDKANWIHGKYENEFVKQDRMWKFSSLKFRFSFICPYEDGWAKAKMPSV